MLLHALIPASRANGPGQRAVVFFQGCTVGCAGCWNPRTHPFHGAEIKV
jgi:anaerobic ribonucleoside-triphosphate reductase activating protein